MAGSSRTAVGEVWSGLSPAVQDIVLALALTAPGLILGALVLRGLHPLPLVLALLRRFLWVNLLFVLLITVSVGLGVGLLAQERGLRQGSARAAEKFDLIVAAPGSEVTVMLAAVYLQPSDMALVTGLQYAEIAAAEGVAFAAPIAFGDSHLGAPVVGTTTDFVTHLAGPLAEGRAFATPVEAVAGAFAPVAVGDSFTPAHGHGPATFVHLAIAAQGHDLPANGFFAVVVIGLLQSQFIGRDGTAGIAHRLYGDGKESGGITATILSGAPKEYPVYRDMCGMYRTWIAALELLDETWDELYNPQPITDTRTVDKQGSP
jgi:hypothetical protein